MQFEMWKLLSIPKLSQVAQTVRLANIGGENLQPILVQKCNLRPSRWVVGVTCRRIKPLSACWRWVASDGWPPSEAASHGWPQIKTKLSNVKAERLEISHTSRICLLSSFSAPN